MRVMTDGLAADGTPWRELQVYYWHPGRNEVCVLGVSPYARGVSIGTIKWEGERAEAVLDLYQSGGRHREMGLLWTFAGQDKYHEVLLEKSGAAGLVPLAEWDHIRSHESAARREDSSEVTVKPSEFFRALEPLIGRIWSTDGSWADGEKIHLQSTFRWLPYADAIHARTIASASGRNIHLLDTYIYHHTGTGSLRCLALTRSGGVYEGDLMVRGDGALECDLDGYLGDQLAPQTMRLEFEKDGTLRHRFWSVDGATRTLDLDLVHTRRQPH